MYKVPNSLPRVYWARHAEVLSDTDALARLFEPDVVAGASVWLSPGSPVPPLPLPPGRAGACTLEAYGNQHIVASCEGKQPGIAVFVEQFDRGWHATVDDRAVPIARANLIMRALPLEPGTHRIVLDYRTPGLTAGLAASGVSVTMLLLLGLHGTWGWRRRRRPGRQIE
jgi:hypothetical protein